MEAGTFDRTVAGARARANAKNVTTAGKKAVTKTLTKAGRPELRLKLWP
jgi:hypothetical protein